MAGPLPPLTSSKTRLTNPGIPLYNEYRGGESDTVREIPPEWRAALDLKVTDQSVPTDEPLFELTDEILASKLEQTFTSEKKLRTVRKPSGVFTLLERFTNKDKEFGTRTRTFHFIDDFGSVTNPSAVKDVSTRNFGNKHFEEIVEEIPGVFDAEEFSVERPVVTPDDFRALLQEHEHGITAPGTAAEPTLSAGDIKKTDTQQDVYLHRTTDLFIDLSTLPQHFDDKETNRYKQVETVRRIFELDSTTPAVPTALRDVKFTYLGDGTAVEEQRTITDVFDQHVYSRERPDPTPQDFAAQLIQHLNDEEFVESGNASQPSLGSSEYRRSEQQLDEFTKKVTVKSRDLSVPRTIVNKKTNQYKQVETVTRLFEVDSTTPAVPTALLDVNFTKLGDGNALEEQVEVEDVFSKQLFQREVQLLYQLPPEFRAALQEVTTSDEEPGTATDPTLDPTMGDVMKSEQQVTEFTKKVETKTRDLSPLPLMFTDYKLTPTGQVVTIVKTLSDSDPGAPTGSALKLDDQVQNMGAGLFLETVETVPDVFDHKSRSTETPDLLPDIFKAVLPTYIHEDVIAATSVTDPPVLATGDFFKSETRETEFTTKIVTRGRAGISLPKNVTAFRRIGGEQFGAEITEMHGFLNDMEPSVETGLDIVSSKVTNLGNGTWFRETEKLDTAVAWPTLDGQNFDKEMQVNVFNEEQTVDPTYTPATTGVGNYFVESLKPIDQYHAKRVKLTKTPSATDIGSALIEEVDGPFQFPGLVYAVSGGYYRRQASAQLCQHIIRTWWMSSATKPTRGLPGSGMDVEVQDIITDDIIISSLNNTSVLEYSGMCLHDAITTFGTFVYAATVPSVTAYIALIGTEIVVGASIEQTDIPNLWKIQTKSVIAR